MKYLTNKLSVVGNLGFACIPFIEGIDMYCCCCFWVNIVYIYVGVVVSVKSLINFNNIANEF